MAKKADAKEPVSDLDALVKENEAILAELEILKAEQEKAIAQETAKIAKEEVTTVKTEIKTLQEDRDALQSDVAALQARILTEREVVFLKGQKTLTGALKGVSYTEYESLKLTAGHVEQMERERDKAISRIAAAEKEVAEAEERAKQALTEKPSLRVVMENAKLTAKLGRIEKWLQQLLNILPEQFKGYIQNILNDREPYHQQRGQNRDRGKER